MGLSAISFIMGRANSCGSLIQMQRPEQSSRFSNWDSWVLQVFTWHRGIAEIARAVFSLSLSCIGDKNNNNNNNVFRYLCIVLMENSLTQRLYCGIIKFRTNMKWMQTRYICLDKIRVIALLVSRLSGAEFYGRQSEMTFVHLMICIVHGQMVSVFDFRELQTNKSMRTCTILQ